MVPPEGWPWHVFHDPLFIPASPFFPKKRHQLVLSNRKGNVLWKSPVWGSRGPEPCEYRNTHWCINLKSNYNEQSIYSLHILHWVHNWVSWLFFYWVIMRQQALAMILLLSLTVHLITFFVLIPYFNIGLENTVHLPQVCVGKCLALMSCHNKGLSLTHLQDHDLLFLLVEIGGSVLE